MRIYEQDILPQYYLALSYTKSDKKEVILHYKAISAKVEDDMLIWLDPFRNKHEWLITPDLRAIYLLSYPFDGDPKKVMKLK